MDQSSGLRTLFADSTYATRESSGAFRIVLNEQIEVSPDQVLWIDEISVVGNVPQISAHNQNLYVVERTPKTFVWQGQTPTLPDGTALTIAANPHRDVSEDMYQFLYITALPGTPQGNTGWSYQAPNGSTLLWYPDDTECKFVARLYHTDISAFDPANPGLFDEVAGTFSYITGQCIWSPRMPATFSPWTFGEVPVATATMDTLRIIQIPTGDYTSATFRSALLTQLNAAAFQGRIPEGSGTQYVVSGEGNELRVGISETLVFGQDTFVILGEPFLKDIRNTKQFVTTWDSNQPRSANAICGNMGT